MAYNHGREDRKWRLWKEAEEKVLRECGVDEAVIEKIRTEDRADFNSNRRFYRWTSNFGEYLEGMADRERQTEIKTIADLLDEIESENEKAVSDGFTVFLSGFADGVDQYFAEAVLELQAENPGLKLIAVLPYRKRVDSLRQNEHTNALLDACAEVIVIQEEYKPNVYAKRSRYMAEHSDRVIAVYDGREKGGTVKTIRFVHQFRKELREIPIGLILDKNRTNLG